MCDLQRRSRFTVPVLELIEEADDEIEAMQLWSAS